jgi:hypothetical protein
MNESVSRPIEDRRGTALLIRNREHFERVQGLALA